MILTMLKRSVGALLDVNLPLLMILSTLSFIIDCVSDLGSIGFDGYIFIKHLLFGHVNARFL